MQLAHLWRRLVYWWKNQKIKISHRLIHDCKAKVLEYEARANQHQKNFDSFVKERNAYARRHGFVSKDEEPPTPTGRLNPQRSIDIR